MGSRGPQSADSKVVRVVTPGAIPRLKPPRKLTDAQKAFWKDMTWSYPATHFVKSDVAQMQAFCIAAATMREAEDHLMTQGRVLTNAAGNQYLNPWQKIFDAQTSVLNNLAAKLRICPSARGSDTRKVKVEDRLPQAQAKRSLG